ncbi:DUF2857 domain-containing protein [Yersinia intermedia]|jgi:hypothetical protein|uniref:DUF2857 domain-containing protein n=1 Tax=Yersinia intermedia TaxID=631 RepID=UPI0005E53E05|nr:DUF2857 domain-containing protein [Yersinia intermedia]MCB5323347.1 DUF2857 domain-containing protein [Yersinia intermedia]CNB23236.1 Protein of uncharacterised function (DUF2857) [Yersinia intermedia]CNB47135.1 Protein of uncharacterised function (DUF2857) [Yersinia intermedia]CNF88449.1 Protein of uncharacterised function (DUF2857) [Yersinia intermedia]CRE46551.1 Protein of uncharacterised function (DUF2857) [Yersinia intermedia]
MIPSLNYAVLTNILHALKEGNFRYCEKLGFTFNELNALNQLSLDELFIVSQASTQFMAITVRHDVLQQLLMLSRQEAKYQQQINRAIRLGGSIALLNHFFGLTSNDVCTRRRLLGVTIPYGRTPIPDEVVDAEIWQLWQKNRPENIETPNALEAMMQVTEALSSREKGPSLTAVWNRITLCEKEALNRRTSHAR